MEDNQQVIFDNDVLQRLDSLLQRMMPNKVFLLMDMNTEKWVLPKLAEWKKLSEFSEITLPAGDLNKSIESLQMVWTVLQMEGATRNSLLVNLGGGMISDLGGFAAATFKRGIRFINVPTTLLAAVDAAVGGKTGINFGGYKNEIGAFCEADAVLISTRFFDTLPEVEMKSGFGEMLKCGLLSGEASFNRMLGYDLHDVPDEALLPLIEESVALKRKIVAEDPTEKGIRKALNLGHTAGHAFESLSLQRNAPVPHGCAVAWGLVVEAVLSHILRGLDSRMLYRLSDYVYYHYGVFKISCDDYGVLLNFMRHDKKSVSGEYNFTLLRSPGDVEVGCSVAEDDVKVALDIYRDLMHI